MSRETNFVLSTVKMSETEAKTCDSERETLQDEIKRIQLALEGETGILSGEEDVDSDDDVLHMVESESEDEERSDTTTTNKTPTSSTRPFNQDKEPLPSTSAIQESSPEDITFLANLSRDTGGDNSIIPSLALIEDLGLPANYQTCLALNRAYQQIISDCLKEIEQLLAANSEKEAELTRTLEQRVGVNNKIDSGSFRKLQVSSYSVPFFKDEDGMCPQSNADVRLKAARAEIRAHQIKPANWKACHKTALKKAVVADAYEKVLRPCMNRKEIQMEKLEAVKKLITETKAELQMAQEEVESENEDFESDSYDEEVKGGKEKQPSNKEIRIQKFKEELKIAKDREKEIYLKIDELDTEMENKKLISDEDLLNEMDPEKIDWMKIASMEFDCKWDWIACKQMWMNVLSPKINRSKWTREENTHLLELIMKYKKQNWPQIAKELGTNRVAFQCLQHYELILNMSNESLKDRISFTPDEDALLMEVVSTCKMGTSIPWTQVSYYMEDKTPVQCRVRYDQINPLIKKGRWSKEEDALLLALVYKYGINHFKVIANRIPNRTVLQCKDRWCNALNPDIRLGEWSYEEDKLMLKLMKQENNSFIRVAHGMKGRTDCQIRKRYNRLMKWKSEPQWFDRCSEKACRALYYIPLRVLVYKLKTMIYLRSKKLPAKPPEAGSQDKEPQRAGVIDLSDLPRKRGNRNKLQILNDENIKRMEETEDQLLVDYMRQLKDKVEGDIVVPRPPNKHVTRCHNLKNKTKQSLRDAVLQKFMEGMQDGMAAIDVMKDIETKPIELVKRVFRAYKPKPKPPTPKKKTGRRLVGKKESLIDKELKLLISNEPTNPPPVLKTGRKRRYFAIDDTNPEQQSLLKARSTTALMKALHTDPQSSWDRIQTVMEDPDYSSNRAGQNPEEVLRVKSVKQAAECLKHMDNHGFLNSRNSSNEGSMEPSRGDYFNIPPLPPSVTSLIGLRGLLLSRKKFVLTSSTLPQLNSLEENAPTDDQPSVTNSSAAKKRLLTINPGVDHIAKYRDTEEYKLLKARFTALFLWPAFLSTVQVHSPDNPKDSKVAEDIDGIKLYHLGEGRKNRKKRPHWKTREARLTKKPKYQRKCGETAAGKRRGRPKGSVSMRTQLLEAGLQPQNQRPSKRLSAKLNISQPDFTALKSTDVNGKRVNESESSDEEDLTPDKSPRCSEMTFDEPVPVEIIDSSRNSPCSSDSETNEHAGSRDILSLSETNEHAESCDILPPSETNKHGECNDILPLTETNEHGECHDILPLSETNEHDDFHDIWLISEAESINMEADSENTNDAESSLLNDDVYIESSTTAGDSEIIPPASSYTPITISDSESDHNIDLNIKRRRRMPRKLP